MEILEEAKRLELGGMDVVHMEVGEPDFDTPPPVVAAANEALARGYTHYTHSLGLLELREAISDWHRRHYGTEVDPDCVVVTSGTSPAMLLAFMAVCEPGDEVVLSDPHYACYPQLISFAGGVPVHVPVRPENGFVLEPSEVKSRLTSRTSAILVNSPSNPFGTVTPPETLAELVDLGVPVISDEIYHGLVYGGEAHSILEYSKGILINGFSKLYAMTGWRLGYLIAPQRVVRAVQKMQQNFFISACHFAQWAAITALSPECERFVGKMLEEYDRRRRLMLEHLPKLGLVVRTEPRGAFYIFADARDHCRTRNLDSCGLAFDILRSVGVAVTPGSDVGPAGEGFLRFSYATGYDRLEEGLRRLAAYFSRAL